MKNSKRNIDDAFSPQNPLNKTDITPDRIQDQLEEKTAVEDIIKEGTEKNADKNLNNDDYRKPGIATGNRRNKSNGEGL